MLDFDREFKRREKLMRRVAIQAILIKWTLFCCFVYGCVLLYNGVVDGSIARSVAGIIKTNAEAMEDGE
jgi:hypothetical protein